jgi:aryl-alcohol dehydrogenase-like predicted oxidoreductase
VTIEREHGRVARHRLALGTVQFGMDYGQENRKVPAVEIPRILRCARLEGMDTLDTAVAYGESEALLGATGIEGWRVVTKVPALPADCRDPRTWVVETAKSSLSRLGVASIHGLLLHRASDLLGAHGDAVYSGLQRCRESGLARKIGISVYAPEELAAIVPRYPMDLIQSPFSVLDRRLRQSGWLERLKASGVEVHARSVFLQGLLLVPDARRPRRFDRWDALWRRWQAWLGDNGMSALEACLHFALAHRELDRVVVGVDTLAQLREVLESVDGDFPLAPPSLACDDVDLIEPSRWRSP